ncbi:hypothetical protein ONZ45_g15913 [Pleurotus djamor]|nr:hypothetical protein ONZ45_g15913 [Pleurotus djamor]
MQTFNAARCHRRSLLNSVYGSSLRQYSSSPRPVSSIKLVAELRKRTEVSITKAREALSASNNDIDAALQWLEKDLEVSGAKKAAKVAGRQTGEGVISTVVFSRGAGSAAGGKLVGNGGSVRAAMIELNCETDFVGRNELFGKLAADIATTAAVVLEPPSSQDAGFFNSIPLDALNDAPLLSALDPQASSTISVRSAIRDTIAKIGENISLRRVLTIAQPAINPSQSTIGLRLASYTHGVANTVFPNQGRMGSLALLAYKSPKLAQILQNAELVQEIERLERSLGRQIVGFPTLSVKPQPGESEETALYTQPFMMLPGELNGQPVRAALTAWAKAHGIVQKEEDGGVEVLDFVKWSVGDSL